MIHRNKNFIICYVNFYMKRFFTAAFILLSISFVHAQNVTGIWRGHFWNNNNLHSKNSIQQAFEGDERYKVEVQIAQNGNAFKGVTYSYLSTIFYAKAEADGTVNDKTKKVLLRELKLDEVRVISGDVYAMTYFLHYSKIGDAEFLEGTFTSMNMRDSSRGSNGVVFLHKVPISDFHKEPFVEKREKEIAENTKPEKSSAPEIKKNNPVTSAKPNASSKKPIVISKKPGVGKDSTSSKIASIKKNTKSPTIRKPVQHNPLRNDIAMESVKPIKIDSIRSERKITAPLIIPKVLSSRQNQLVKTITVNTNEIELDIYDDGTIDNDTVSVYLDKKLVISHAMLTDRAIVMKVHLDDDNDYHEVVMVADNEGTIPPNTSLMIVKAGDKRYEVRIVSTEQKNATVIFKYEKPK
jgi:hypothetical protein